MKKYQIAFVLQLIGFGFSANAQSDLPTVANIPDFFSQSIFEIKAGAQPILVSRGTPASEKMLQHDLKIRIFSLGSSNTMPSHSAIHEECELYISSTYPVKVVGQTLELMHTSHNWLGASPIEDKVLSGRYWVVLESANESKGDLLLLNKKDKLKYFASGMLLVVNPTGDPAKDQIMEAFKVRRKLLEAIELEIASKIDKLTCFGFKKITAQSGNNYSEEILTCGLNEHINSI